MPHADARTDLRAQLAPPCEASDTRTQTPTHTLARVPPPHLSLKRSILAVLRSTLRSWLNLHLNPFWHCGAGGSNTEGGRGQGQSGAGRDRGAAASPPCAPRLPGQRLRASRCATPTRARAHLAVAEELADDALGVDAHGDLGLLDGHRKERVELALPRLLGRLLLLLAKGGGRVGRRADVGSSVHGLKLAYHPAITTHTHTHTLDYTAAHIPPPFWPSPWPPSRAASCGPPPQSWRPLPPGPHAWGREAGRGGGRCLEKTNAGLPCASRR